MASFTNEAREIRQPETTILVYTIIKKQQKDPEFQTVALRPCPRVTLRDIACAGFGLEVYAFKFWSNMGVRLYLVVLSGCNNLKNSHYYCQF